MPINNITQTISTIPPAGARGVDVQTQFVIKQEDFQDHLQGTTVTELNTLKDQLNTRIGEINSTATTMNGYASTASAGASTATTKAGEASTSASGALTSRNQAETFKNNASTSATKASQWADGAYNVEVETGKFSAKHWATVAQNTVVDLNQVVKLTGNQTIAGIKTFSSAIVGNITGNSGTATNATNVSGGYGTFSGLITTKVNNASFAGANDTTLSVRGDATYSAIMSFHRAGAFAVNFGLDTDNKLKVGGWSMGSVYEIYHQGNPQPITGLGIGQTWQDVTASRVAGTTYTNSTGKPIMLDIISYGGANNKISISLNSGSAFNFGAANVNTGNAICSGSVIVPTGVTYNITSVGALQTWVELR